MQELSGEMPKRIFWFRKEGEGTTNIIQGLEAIRRCFGKVFPEEYIEDTIVHILLANVSRNGEI